MNVKKMYIGSSPVSADTQGLVPSIGIGIGKHKVVLYLVND